MVEIGQNLLIMGSDVHLKLGIKNKGLGQRHQIYAYVLIVQSSFMNLKPAFQAEFCDSVWVTFGDLSKCGILWSPLVLLVTYVCARL